MRPCSTSLGIGTYPLLHAEFVYFMVVHRWRRTSAITSENVAVRLVVRVAPVVQRDVGARETALSGDGEVLEQVRADCTIQGARWSIRSCIHGAMSRWSAR